MGVEQKSVPVAALYLAEQYATEYLQKGRIWDLPHTKAVAYYAGKISSEERLDSLILVTTAWLHDIGYSGLFKDDESRNYDQVQDKKFRHMVIGEQRAREFLGRGDVKGFYTDIQKYAIIHLVSVHDQLEKLNHVNELVFMEADTLGQIDIGRVTPTFDREQVEKYILRDLKERRWPKFISQTGKQLYKELYPKFLNYFGIPTEGEYKLF